MEKAICCSKMSHSVWCTRATWTTAPSLEMGFIAMQKLSSIAQILVRLEAHMFLLTLNEMYLFFHDNVDVNIFVFSTTEILEFCNQDVCSIFQ